MAGFDNTAKQETINQIVEEYTIFMADYTKNTLGMPEAIYPSGNPMYVKDIESLVNNMYDNIRDQIINNLTVTVNVITGIAVSNTFVVTTTTGAVQCNITFD
jgi:hypothetical protein